MAAASISVVLIAVIIGLAALSFRFGIQRGEEGKLAVRGTSAVLAAVCGILSHEKYGAGRYVCASSADWQMRNAGLAYDQATLARLGKTLPQWLEDTDSLNAAIEKVFTSPPLPAAGRVSDLGWGMDVGYMDFVDFAFRVFGHRIEALYNGFFLLLIISTILFCVQFWRTYFALFVVLSFHFALLSYLPLLSGVEIDSVNNYRFLSLLALIPALHGLLLILYRVRPTWCTILVFAPQAILLAAAADFRALAYGAAIALAINTMLLLTSDVLWRKRTVRQSIPRYWPVGLVLFCVLAGMALQAQSADPRIAQIGGMRSHTIWEPLYYDLQNSPEWRSKYSARYHGATGDDVAVVGANSYRRRHNLMHNKSDFINGDEAQGLTHSAYEKYTRAAYLEFVLKDPWFVVRQKLDTGSQMVNLIRANIALAWSALNWRLLVVAAIAAIGTIVQVGKRVESLELLTSCTALVGFMAVLVACPVWMLVLNIDLLADLTLLTISFTFIAALLAVVVAAVWLSKCLSPIAINIWPPAWKAA